MDKPEQPETETTKAKPSGTKLSRAAQREQEATRRTALARQKLLLILVGGALLINGVLAYWLHGSLIQGVEQERLEQQRTEETEARVREVERYLTELRQTLAQAVDLASALSATTEADGVSESQAEVELPAAQASENAPAMAGTVATESIPAIESTAVTGSTAATQDALREKISALFANPLAVRLIPLGTATMDRDHAVPIRFAELDLIRRAERGENTPPEMVKVGDNWHLHLIALLPTSADQSPWGSLLVTLDNSVLAERVERLGNNLGQTQLVQKFEDVQPLVLIQTGSGNAAGSFELPVRNSHWHVRFTPSTSMLSRVEEPPTLLILILCVTGLISLILVWVLSRVLVRHRPAAHVAPVQATTAAAPAKPEPVNSADNDMASPMYQNQDILDIEVIDEDDDILGLKEATGKQPKREAPAAKSAKTLEVPEGIFRSYDIRGLADTEITPELAEHIGQAVGSEALDQGDASVIVARDGRLHSPILCEHLIQGIMRSGCQVIDIGVVPTPVLYFATFHLADTSSGVMVTASHNPADYNGFKIVINGTTLADDAILDIRARVQHQKYHRGEGDREQRDLVPDYIDRIFSDVALAGQLSLVIDAGNAVTGSVAPRLFEELGCDVTQLHCDLDGSFPNHDPDPTREENLRDLIAKVKEVNADVGVAFDGDGDRLVVVTPSGQIIWPDRLLMLFAKDILARNPGADVIFDVKCSRQLNQLITSYGGRPIMWKTGHSPMKSKMIETGALIGGEYSGHIFIKDRWYGFDDGMYAMARLLEIVTLRDQTVEDVFAGFPLLPATPELKISVPDGKKFALVDKLIAEGNFQSGKATTIDGLRVDFGKGWGLVRASNTSPALTLRFEADSEDALKKIQQLFKRELLKIDSTLTIDF